MSLAQIQLVPIADIHVTDQVRREFDETALEGLAVSLREVGQLQPIRCRFKDRKFVVVDGERRLRAAQRAGIAALQVIVEPTELSASDVVQRQLIANLQREDLSPLEKAKGIASLMTETGWNASEVAAHLGMSNATVSRILTLLELPEDIQQQVAAGKIAPSAAAELAKVKDAARQSELAGQVASGKLTRDGLAKATRPRKRRVGAKPVSERLIAMLGAGRVVSIFAPSLSIESAIELLEELLAKARKAKVQNLSIPTFAKLLEDQSRC
jgi:ParB family chromosome partitioning protein